MVRERTFAMIKPDAVKAHIVGKIITMIENHGFEILRLQKVHLTKDKVERFYAIHSHRPFFSEMVSFIISGPVIIMALEKDNAVLSWRKLMGATNPKDADEGTIRKLYGTDIGQNVVHGSDATETACEELGLFFPDLA
jgi:nucleoside-diphosphate kinase